MRKNLLKDSWKLIGGICLIILVNSIVYFIFKDPASAGTFGDIFGLSNALFSGFAFAGIIYTILLQQEDINLQRKELRLTRKEYKTQNETLALQRFESTFFSMLENHQSLLSYMKIETFLVYSNVVIDGVADIQLYEELQSSSMQTFTNKDIFKFLHHKFMYYASQEQYRPVRKAYYRLYDEHQDILGHYFRNIYRIVKMIDGTEFIKGNNQKNIKDNFDLRYKYTSILRSQFSVFELMLIFYNCLSDNGKDEFKPLLEKYTLLKNTPNDVLYHPVHKYNYLSSAFFKCTE